MSSYIKKTSSDFFVPTEHTGKVLAAGLRFLPDALFCFPMDREGNIVDVKAEGCILSEMREMLAAIAPWVREGSYGEAGKQDRGRWPQLDRPGTLTVLAARGTAPLYRAIPLVAEYEVQILAHTGSSPCRALTGGRYTDIIVLKKLDWR